MPTPDVQKAPAILNDSAVERILSGVNTEVKCLALGALPDETPVHLNDVHNTLAVESRGNAFYNLTRDALGRVLTRMPDNLVEFEQTAQGRIYTRTAAGRLAASVGGHLLRLSAVSKVPTRVLVGEHSPSRSVNSVERTTGSIRGRLIVYRGLRSLDVGEWRSGSELVAGFATEGLSRAAAYNHLSDLHERRLVEMTERTPGTQAASKPMNYRVKPTKGGMPMPPTQIVGRYLRIVDRLTTVDSVAYRRGLEEMDSIVHDELLVPFLVRRSFTASGHTDKVVQRVNGKGPRKQTQA